MPADLESENFDKIVEWAYGTLPEAIRELPDFPGIQIVDEPPEHVLSERKRPPGTEILGLYSGQYRTKRQFNRVQTAPDLIFVFRGPILRCCRGNLRAEIKRTVWHEVAHWLGHDEEAVTSLGLSALSPGFEDVDDPQVESKARTVEVPVADAGQQQQPAKSIEGTEDAVEPKLRCSSCYSADVTCREVERSIAVSGAWLSDAFPVRNQNLYMRVMRPRMGR
jgi:predicted Zn-dependent protease with MMP-like domain